MEDDLKKRKVRISQQPLAGSYRNLKLMLMGPSQMLWKLDMKTTFHGRRPPMEDDLKISKVEYLSNRLLDQIFNLGLDDHIIFYKLFD